MDLVLLWVHLRTPRSPRQEITSARIDIQHITPAASIPWGAILQRHNQYRVLKGTILIRCNIRCIRRWYCPNCKSCIAIMPHIITTHPLINNCRNPVSRLAVTVCGDGPTTATCPPRSTPPNVMKAIFENFKGSVYRSTGHQLQTYSHLNWLQYIPHIYPNKKCQIYRYLRHITRLRIRRRMHEAPPGTYISWVIAIRVPKLRLDTIFLLGTS